MFFLARLIGRRFGPLGYVLTAYALWRQLPKQRRDQILAHIRAHVPHRVKA